MSNDGKLVSLGDILVSTVGKDSDEPKKDSKGRAMYHMQVYLPKEVPSVTLKNGDYINFREVTEDELEKMPEWKRKLIQLKAWMKID